MSSCQDGLFDRENICIRCHFEPCECDLENHLVNKGYLVSVKISDTEYKHFKVPQEVYIYIKQLEMCIIYPQYSGLKNLYPDRFSLPNEK